LSHHIFRVAEAFLETPLTVSNPGLTMPTPARRRTCKSGDEIAAYGDGIIARLETWWSQLEDKSCEGPVKTFYGTPSDAPVYWSDPRGTRAAHAPADGRARAALRSSPGGGSRLKISPACRLPEACGDDDDDDHSGISPQVRQRRESFGIINRSINENK